MAEVPQQTTQNQNTACMQGRAREWCPDLTMWPQCTQGLLCNGWGTLLGAASKNAEDSPACAGS